MSTLANLTEVLFRLDFDPDTAVYHYRGQTLSRLQCRTYILSQASQLARLLKPGDRVVLALNDSPSLACLFLACIAVGAIPAVINPKSREQALADIAADCQASLVVREADAPSLSGPLAPLTLRAAAGRPLLDDFSLDALVGPADLDWSAFHRQDPAAACFLQYTSGSTGAPKGVMHSLRNTLGFCRAFATELLALQAGDRLYSIPKMFFGYGMGNSLFFPWFSGASALLDDTWPSPERVLENLVAFRPRVLFGVPAIYASLRAQARELLSSVRLAFSAGSPLPRGEFEFWAAHGLEICDGIGATEVGHVFLANRPGQARADSTGLPLPGYECRLVDREGHTIEEAGQQGVLLVRGPGLSPGGQRRAAGALRRWLVSHRRPVRARRVGCLPPLWAGRRSVQGEWPLGGADPGRAGDLPSSAGSERGGSGSYLPAARRLASDPVRHPGHSAGRQPDPAGAAYRPASRRTDSLAHAA